MKVGKVGIVDGLSRAVVLAVGAVVEVDKARIRSRMKRMDVLP